MKARLVFVTGSRAGTSIELGPGTSSIGRRPDQKIRFSPDEILVSSAHGSIEDRDGAYVLRDLGSRNGTYVNQERVTERTLVPGDVIEFGPRGPSAQFLIADEKEMTPTLDMDQHPAARELFKKAAAKASQDDSPTLSRGFSTTREFVAMTYKRGKRARRRILTVLVSTIVVFGGLFLWQERSRSALQQSLMELGSALELERGSRSNLETDLFAIQVGYDSLLAEVEDSRRRLEESGRRAALTPGSIAGRYSGGVALIVFSWGFGERGGDRLLRYQLDPDGRPRFTMLRTGRRIPALGFEGSGPPVAVQGSATGFLVDSTGWIVTNKHVAEPWLYDEDLAFLQDDPALEPQFLALRAFFPPGDKVFPLTVHATSDTREIDVAALKTRDQLVDAPVVPLRRGAAPPTPGQQLVFIGYPTGVHNLLFRVPDSVRNEILRSVGDEPVPLATELARRNLIQPLAIAGSVSDTTAIEIIHTAGTTGGGSGGPLIGVSGDVLGIHYAAVRSPIQGDPFQTQRGVRASFAWRVLPGSLRREQ